VQKLLGLARQSRYRRALRHGVAAAIEHEHIPYLETVRAVVDVGAHKGQFAVFALERFPEASVICIEPLGEPRRQLKLAVDQTNRVRVLEVAASNRTGDRVPMHVSRADDSSSLRSIEPRYVAAFPGTEEAGRTWVPAARLDALLDPGELPQPALLKIDVQGHEYEVLEGSEGLLPAFRQIVVEVSFTELYGGQKLAGDVTTLLRNAGFALTGVFNIKLARSGECLQADFLFEQRDDSEQNQRPDS
jgi:FkbM family methyltransferase